MAASISNPIRNFGMMELVVHGHVDHVELYPWPWSQYADMETRLLQPFTTSLGNRSSTNFGLIQIVLLTSLFDNNAFSQGRCSI